MEQKVEPLDNEIYEAIKVINKTGKDRMQVLGNKLKEEMKNFKIKINKKHGNKT